MFAKKIRHSVREYSGWDQRVAVLCEIGLQAPCTARGAKFDAHLLTLRISPRDGVYLGHCSLVHCVNSQKIDNLARFAESPI